MDILQKWFPYSYRDIKEKQKSVNLLNASEDSVNIFCFPSAGSGASLYRPWSQSTKLNKTIDFIPVEIPGRGNHITSPISPNIDKLVDEFSAVFLQLPKQPYILYGHSFGAVVAFQIAHTIQEKGLRLPEKLIVAGRHAPHMKDTNPLSSVSSDDEMIAEMKAMGGTPDIILEHPEMLKFTISQLRGDLRTHESFKYTGQKLNIPIEAHCGKDDDANKPIVEYWREVTEQDFFVKEFEGHHFFIKTLGDTYLKYLVDSVNKLKTHLT